MMRKQRMRIMIMAHCFGWVGWSEYWGLCPLLDALHILIITMKISCCNAMMKNDFYVRASTNGDDEGYGNNCKAFFDVFVVGMCDTITTITIRTLRFVSAWVTQAPPSNSR